MGFATIIGAIVGVFLLLVVAYLLIGASLITAEVVMTAQRDMTEVQTDKTGTSIAIDGYHIADNTTLFILVKNDGTTVIKNPLQMDLFLATDIGTQTREEWQKIGITPDLINPGFLDPGEVLNMSVSIDELSPPIWVKVATPTGTAASAYL
jgi:flagellar protein FlaF